MKTLFHVDPWLITETELRREDRAAADAATAAGAVGLEAMYTNYTPAQEQAVRVLAAERGLLCTGGTDYHGARKPDIALGRGCGTLRVPYALLAKLKE